MASGGSRARSGPPPDPNALRRERDNGEWIDLPPEGRDGPLPAWPLGDITDRESQHWAREWRRPQAVMWERNGQELEVALFIRALIAAEGGDYVDDEGFPIQGTAADRNVVQRKMTDLGLTVAGLRANRWRIPRLESPKATPKKKTTRRRKTAKERLHLVQGGS